jgi:tetratricopeptide (TPR) repeat protein
MYKNQFARWGFFKYSIKGRPRSKAESPTDQSSQSSSDDSLDGAIVLSRDELLHADGGSRSMQAGLTAVRRFLHGHIDRDPANLQVEEVAGFVDPCYRYFKVAMDLFDLKENLEGGRVLRLAFLQIERKISKPTMKSFSDLCFLVPHLLLESNRRDILSAYLHYLSGLATVKFGKHPVAELAAAFASLVDDRPQDMMRYIMLLSQINSDTIAALPGMLDRNREWARNQYLACQRIATSQSNTSSGDGAGSDDHDHHMIRLEAQSVYWAQKLVMQDPESDEMAAQWLRRRFEPGFGPRCEAYVAKLKERAAQGGFPVMFARMMETLFVGWLADYYETVGDWDRALEWGRRGLELSTDEQYAIWSIHLEGLMRRCGRGEEAEELGRRRREHAWLERVRLEVDRLSIADG